MAKNCYGRRLSELLQEQQEPFLLDARRPCGACCSMAAACKRRLLRLCNHGFIKKHRGGGGGTARSSSFRRVLSRVLCSWGFAACFSGASERFRRLPHAGDIGDRDAIMEFADEEDDDGGRHERQLSPVSVLELHSDDEGSPMLSHWEDEKPSTSGSSPPPCEDILVTFYNRDKVSAVEVEDEKVTIRSGKSMEEKMISSWERIAVDISKISRLVELDLCSSMEKWRQLRRHEVAEIGAKLEAIIFEEMKGEAVSDMLTCFPVL